MRKLLLINFALSICLLAQPWSTFLDPSRAIDWTSGVGFGIPQYSVPCSTQPTLTPNSVASAITNRTQIQNALASCDATHNVVNIPAGAYYVYGIGYGKQVVGGIQGRQVLRGAGPMSTTLLPVGTAECSLGGGICMQPASAQGANSSSQIPPSGNMQCLWTAGFSKGTTSITLSSCGGTPTSGQMMILSQANDTSDTGGVYVCDTATSDCSVEGVYQGNTNQNGPVVGGITYSQQQIVWPTSVTNNGDGTYTVAITPGVYFNNVRLGQTPLARWPNTVQLEGLENLTVDNSYVFPAPTVGTPTAGGSCTPGTHSMKVAFVYHEGFNDYYSSSSAASVQFTCVAGSGQTVPVTVPLGPTGTVARTLFVTKAGDAGSYFAVAARTINDNTTTNYSFTTADGSLSGGYDPGQIGGIQIANCYQCWITNVRGVYAGRDHVILYQSLNPIIRDSYFYEAFAHGTQSYGVELETVSGALIENNIFHTVTNPVALGQASGSVFAYNYAVNEGFDNQAAQTLNAGHNAGNGMNLWEGNNVFGIWTDDSWGSNGGSTEFRNMMRGWQSGKTQYTYALMVEARNRAFNAIGNVLGQPAYHTHYESYAPSVNGGDAAASLSIYNLNWSNISACSPVPCDTLARSTLMRWGNYTTIGPGDGAAQVTWDTTEASPGAVTYVNANFSSTYFGSLAHTLPASLYYASKPSWWPAAKAWPAIGPDVSTGNVGTCSGTYAGSQATSSGQCTGGTLSSAWESHVGSIPAQDCYLNVMQGPPDGSGDMLRFDANSCYNAVSVSVTGGTHSGGTTPTQ